MRENKISCVTTRILKFALKKGIFELNSTLFKAKLEKLNVKWRSAFKGFCKFLVIFSQIGDVSI